MNSALSAPAAAAGLSPLAARIVGAFPTLAGAPPATLERIARSANHRNMQAGTLMFSEHSPCGGFPLVLAGSIRVLQIVEAVAYQKLDQRLAALLVGKTAGREINATHRALADELGSVREIVSRLLRSFEDLGWVELGRERVMLVDRDALTLLAKG